MAGLSVKISRNSNRALYVLLRSDVDLQRLYLVDDWLSTAPRERQDEWWILVLFAVFASFSWLGLRINWQMLSIADQDRAYFRLCRQWRPEIQSGHQSAGFGMESHWATKTKRCCGDTFYQADPAGCTTLPEHVHVQHTWIFTLWLTMWAGRWTFLRFSQTHQWYDGMTTRIMSGVL